MAVTRRGSKGGSSRKRSTGGARKKPARKATKRAKAGARKQPARKATKRAVTGARKKPARKATKRAATGARKKPARKATKRAVTGARKVTRKSVGARTGPQPAARKVSSRASGPSQKVYTDPIQELLVRRRRAMFGG